MNDSFSQEERLPPPQPALVEVRLPRVAPVVTYSLLIITVLFYLLQLASRFHMGVDLLAYYGAKQASFIRIGQYWRLITPVFLHVSLAHIALNMYALVRFGAGLEARFGHWRFALLYLSSGFAGNVLSFLLTPAASVGASTAIFGLLAAEGVFLYQNRALLRQYAAQALGNILFLAALNLFLGFSSNGIDNWGHIGGLLGGLLFTWFGGPRWKVEGIYPTYSLVDERRGHGALTGLAVVLLVFGALTALALFSPR